MSTLADAVERELGLALDATDRAQLARLGAGADVRTAAGSVLVHETWFFRDARVFDELESIARASRGPLRVLSAPCATGEEAWSIAMALADAGLGPGAFEVVGVDVGAAAISAARAGRYGPASFRGEHRPVLDAWLVREGPIATVHHPLAASVRFRTANLVAPGALSDEMPFDVIFCRNFLVYLTTEARSAIERLVLRLLTPTGALFLGAGETLGSGAFVRQGAADRFLFRRAAAAIASSPRSATSREPPRRASRSSAPGRVRPAVKPSGRPPAAKPSGRPPAAKPSARSEHAPTLDEVRTLADRGELDAALELCERVLSRDGHAAETYALLGTIQSARGRAEQAREAWRRALYLDPQNEVARGSLGDRGRRIGAAFPEKRGAR